MNNWQETGVLLALRPHGENGLIVTLLTAGQGRHIGYIPGGQSRSRRSGLEIGAVVDARWQARVLDQMGTFSLEPISQPAARVMDDPLKLAALRAACALCDSALPERESHPALYHGLIALLEQLDGEAWGPAYVLWEIAFMKELGFALDLTRCAAGGSANDLVYVSPKSGVAVSREYGALYKSKLLPLPEFLKASSDLESLGTLEDVLTGLRLTGYFLEHWVFAQHSQGMPEVRMTLTERLGRMPSLAATVA